MKKLLASLLVCAMLSSCTSSASTTGSSSSGSSSNSSKAGGTSSVSKVDPEVPAEAALQEKTRDNSGAVQTSLHTGTFTVGTDIPAGRYIITSKGTGNFFVLENEVPIVNEVLDDGTVGMGVPSVTTDLEEGQQVEISGINELICTPAETTLSNTLTAGNWIVGLDIAPGKYDATCNDGESGNLIVSSKSFPVVNEILDKSGMGIGVEQVRVELKNNQVIQVLGISQVIFTPQ